MSEEQKTKKKYKYTQIGTVMEKKKDKPDDPTYFTLKLEQQTTKDGKPYGDQIFPITLANGKVIESGTFLTMFAIQPKLQKKVENNQMSQKDAEKLSFLRYEVCLSEAADGSSEPKSGDDINF